MIFIEEVFLSDNNIATDNKNVVKFETLAVGDTFITCAYNRAIVLIKIPEHKDSRLNAVFISGLSCGSAMFFSPADANVIRVRLSAQMYEVLPDIILESTEGKQRADKYPERGKQRKTKMTDKSIDDGGPVYPQYSKQISGNVYEMGPEGGITRRDWLAGLAMQGILANQKVVDAYVNTAEANNKLVPDAIAETSYIYADALIAEGRKQ